MTGDGPGHHRRGRHVRRATLSMDPLLHFSKEFEKQHLDFSTRLASALQGGQPCHAESMRDRVKELEAAFQEDNSLKARLELSAALGLWEGVAVSCGELGSLAGWSSPAGVTKNSCSWYRLGAVKILEDGLSEPTGGPGTAEEARVWLLIGRILAELPVRFFSQAAFRLTAVAELEGVATVLRGMALGTLGWLYAHRCNDYSEGAVLLGEAQKVLEGVAPTDLAECGMSSLDVAEVWAHRALVMCRKGEAAAAEEVISAATTRMEGSPECAQYRAIRSILLRAAAGCAREGGRLETAEGHLRAALEQGGGLCGYSEECMRCLVELVNIYQMQLTDQDLAMVETIMDSHEVGDLMVRPEFSFELALRTFGVCSYAMTAVFPHHCTWEVMLCYEACSSLLVKMKLFSPAVTSPLWRRWNGAIEQMFDAVGGVLTYRHRRAFLYAEVVPGAHRCLAFFVKKIVHALDHAHDTHGEGADQAEEKHLKDVTPEDIWRLIISSKEIASLALAYDQTVFDARNVGPLWDTDPTEILKSAQSAASGVLEEWKGTGDKPTANEKLVLTYRKGDAGIYRCLKKGVMGESSGDYRGIMSGIFKTFTEETKALSFELEWCHKLEAGTVVVDFLCVGPPLDHYVAIVCYRRTVGDFHEDNAVLESVLTRSPPPEAPLARSGSFRARSTEEIAEMNRLMLEDSSEDDSKEPVQTAVFVLGDRTEIEAHIDKFVALVANSSSSIGDFKREGLLLRDKLMDNILPFLGRNCTRLLLCPDAALWRVPFEALPSHIPEVLEYMDGAYTISYLNSARWIPSFGESDAFSPAPEVALTSDATHPTVTPLTKVFGEHAEVVRDSPPMKSFLSGKDASLLQLDTRAEAFQDGGSVRSLSQITALTPLEVLSQDSVYLASWIGSDDRCSSVELADRNIRDNMSKCELVVWMDKGTAVTGQLYKRGLGSGGALSGFGHAVRNVVHTMYEMPEDSLADMLESFYDNLTTGRDICKALRMARSTERSSRPHPSAWSGLVLHGAAWGVPLTRFGDHIDRRRRLFKKKIAEACKIAAPTTPRRNEGPSIVAGVTLGGLETFLEEDEEDIDDSEDGSEAGPSAPVSTESAVGCCVS